MSQVSCGWLYSTLGYSGAGQKDWAQSTRGQSKTTVQVYFPERPGALRAFLSEIVPTWNLTLFHYRKSGNTSTSILIGMQVPPETEEAFKAAQRALGDEFDFTELDDNARQMFDMFIS